MPEVRQTAVLVIILASYLMIVLDISIAITALPKIRQGLGFSAPELSWVQNAYTLAFGGLLLGGMTALVYGTVRSTAASWTDGLTVAPLTFGVPLMALFVLNEWRAKQPIMPLHRWS